MGSRTKRKENDQPIIRVPKISGVEQIKGKPEQAFDICKVSFDVIVTNRAFAIVNAPVQLILRGSIYAIDLAGTEVGKLTDRQSTMVTKCVELGVKYKGKIVEEKGEVYARFVRIA